MRATGASVNGRAKGAVAAVWRVGVWGCGMIEGTNFDETTNPVFANHRVCLSGWHVVLARCRTRRLVDQGGEDGLPGNRPVRRDDGLRAKAGRGQPVGPRRNHRHESRGAGDRGGGGVAGPGVHAGSRAGDGEGNRAGKLLHPSRRVRGQGREPRPDPGSGGQRGVPEQRAAGPGDPRRHPDHGRGRVRAVRPLQPHQPERTGGDGVAGERAELQPEPGLGEGRRAGDPAPSCSFSTAGGPTCSWTRTPPTARITSTT